MDPEIRHEQIEAYLAGKLNSDDLASFEKQLASDVTLRDEVERHRKAEVAIQYGFQQAMKQRLQRIDTEMPTTVRGRRIWIRRLAAAAASVLIVAAGIELYAYKNYRHAAIAEHLFALSSTGQSRGTENETTTLTSQLAEAQRLFLAGNYDQARDYYLVVIKENSLLREKAEWNLLLCYFAMDPGSPQFKMLLKKILDDPAHSYHSKALTLQDRMSTVWYHLVNS